MGNGTITLYKNHILTKDEFQQFNSENGLYAGKLYLNSLNCKVNYTKQLYLVEDGSYYIAWALDELLDIDIPTTDIKFKNKSGSKTHSFSKATAKTILGDRDVEEKVSIDLGEFHDGIQLSGSNSITCAKPKYSVFQTLTTENIQLRYKKLEGRTVVEQGYISNISITLYGSTISIKAKPGLSIYMPGHFLLSVECLITPRFSYLPVDDIGLSELVDAYTLYQFNGKTIEEIYKFHPYLYDAFEVVAGGAKNSSGEVFDNSTTLLKAYSEVEKDYQSSVSDDIIHKDFLEKIGVSKISIPRYKISENQDEYHFEGLSFPANQMQMTTKMKETGQFCHDGDLQPSSSVEVDAKYWSTTPHIYPEIVFNNTDRLDNSDWRIVKRGNSLIINSKTYTLYENDSVVFYTRDPGTWKPDSSEKIPFLYGTKVFSEFRVALPDNDDTCNWREYNKYSQTGTLVCQPISMYELITDIDQNFSTTQRLPNTIPESLYKIDNNQCFEHLILPITENSEIDFASLKGVSDHTGDGKLKLFIGKYDGDKVLEHCDYAMKCRFSNLSYVGMTPAQNQTWYFSDVRSNTSTKETKVLGDVKCNLSSIEETGVITTNEGYLTATFDSVPGLFPTWMRYHGANYCDDYQGFINFPNPWHLKVQGEISDAVSPNIMWCYAEFEDVFIIFPVSSTSFAHTSRIEIGYHNRISDPTYATAVVIWRNGKLMSGISSEGFRFVFKPSWQGYAICGYSGSGGNVLIPATYKDFPVIEIDKMEHENIRTLTSEGPLSISVGVFKGNKTIEKIDLYQSASICGMFTGTNYPDHMTDDEVQQLYPKTLTNVIFHTGAPYHYCFYNAGRIKNISLRDPDLSAIGEKAFYNCGVENLTIPYISNLTLIEQYAFYNCLIKELDLSNSNLEYIGPYAFAGCGLAEIDLSNSTDLHEITQYCFNDTYRLASITLPESIYYINDYAFSSSALKSIDLSHLKQLNSIRNYAFASSDLEWISLPDEGDLKTFEHGVFCECLYLQDMDIPNTVDTLGNNVFDGCGALKKIWIPESVIYMGYQCFYNCSSNLVIYCEAETKPAGWHQDWNNGNYEVKWGASFRDYQNA